MLSPTPEEYTFLIYLRHSAFRISIGVQRLIPDLLDLIAHGRQLIRRLHQSSALGIFRNLANIVRCIFRSIPGLI